MSKQKEVRYVPARELRATKNDDGTRTITGYAAVFGVLSVDFGGWQETIAPGAFTRSLMTNPDVVCLRDHNSSILLGRTRSKTLSLEQDSVGLRFTCLLPDTTQASDLVALMERGDIDGCSFSFIAVMEDWKTNEDGLTVRTVIEADLFDVSVVSEPAYPDTSVSLRNAPKEIRSFIESHDVPTPEVQPPANVPPEDDHQRNRAHMVIELAKHRTS
jgi:HK97 family phage prohead protease